jgi:oligoendopeptidase F
MLKSGSTRNVTELLKPFDLDPADEKFWANGIDVGLGRMVEEVEQLSRELGVI